MKHRSRALWIVGLLVSISVGCGALIARAQFDFAVQDFERQNYDQAIARLERTIREGGDSARVRTLLGWSLYKKGNLTRARTEFERALRMDAGDPNSFYAHEGLGWVAYKSGQHDRAITAFSESLKLSPGYPNAKVGLGWAYLAKRDLVRAAANFQGALDANPNDTDARRGLGFVAYHRGDWAQAIVRFREVLQRDERDTLTRSALAWTYYYKGDYADARPIFLDVARREPAWADPQAGLAWIAERQGRAEEAKAQFRAAMAKSARYVAIPELRKLLSSRPAWADLWRELAWALYQQRAFSESEAEFRALVTQHPSDADGLRGLGYALYALKRYRDAIAPLRRSLELEAALPPVREQVEIPGVPRLHSIVSDAGSTLAWSLHYSGDLGAALPQFRDLTRRHPDWPDGWSGLGWTLLKLGNRTESEQAFLRSLQAEAGYPDAIMGLRALGKAVR